jgi:hypothetical protein
MVRLWSVETTHVEDLFWFCLCIFALLTIHWSLSIGLWALHFLFTVPKEIDVRM